MHIPVLLKETIEGLNIKSGDIFFDVTVGSGGHDLYVCEHFGKSVKIIGIDQDKDALKRATERLADKKCDITYRVNNFRNIKDELENLNINQVNEIMLDLGLSSEQLESSGRGFSFMRDEPLLMTMAKDSDTSTLTARDIVNTWQEEMIQNIISGFGEERYAKRIARKITESRERRRIETTLQLVEIIRQAVPISYQHSRIHFATKTFQALRIAVNDEINSLKEFLQNGFEYLTREGRMAIICFHSIEDRIVKNFNREKQKASQAKIITKKPIVPSFDEIKNNPRSRSAKLRILEKL